jgi:hypothetical protein
VEFLETAFGPANPEAQLVDFGAHDACFGCYEELAAVVVEEYCAAVC